VKAIKQINMYRKQHFCLFILITITLTSVAQTVIPLYPGKVPNSTNAAEEETTDASQSKFYKVSNPKLGIYLPSKKIASKTAVIICAGGGYGELNIKREGYDVAEEFNKIGVAAFVLKYRLPYDKLMVDKTIAPLQDAQQAIKIVRDSAAKWDIDPNKIGIMGFSAGGHLASTAGTHFDKALIDNPSQTSVRPDFMILVYPVISFNDSIGHLGSRNNLLGKSPAPQLIKKFSNELQVNKQTPQTFLTHASDDRVVVVNNSIHFYKALIRNAVVAEMHIYSRGGHGFGTTPAFDEWFGRCLYWMRSNQLIK
jgi:acetyl esterase/lipase